MQIPNADFLERTGSQILGRDYGVFRPRAPIPCTEHVRAEEFYFVVEGMGRIRVADQTLTVPRLGGVLVGPAVLRQLFNDTDSKVLWLVTAAPETELEPHQVGDMSLFYPVSPTQLPPELAGEKWPPDKK